MSENVEYEEVTIRVPKPIMQLLKDMEKTKEQAVKEYLETSIIEAVESQLAAGTFCSPDHIIEKYDLKPTFKEYNVLQSSY